MKSTPVYVNGGESWTRNDDGGGWKGRSTWLSFIPAAHFATGQDAFNDISALHYPASRPQLCQGTVQFAVHNSFMGLSD